MTREDLPFRWTLQATRRMARVKRYAFVLTYIFLRHLSLFQCSVAQNSWEYRPSAIRSIAVHVHRVLWAHNHREGLLWMFLETTNRTLIGLDVDENVRSYRDGPPVESIRIVPYWSEWKSVVMWLLWQTLSNLEHSGERSRVEVDQHNRSHYQSRSIFDICRVHRRRCCRPHFTAVQSLPHVK